MTTEVLEADYVIIGAAARRKVPELRQWLSACRLNAYATMIERAACKPTPEGARIRQRFRDASGPALERLAQLLAQSSGGKADRAATAVINLPCPERATTPRRLRNESIPS